MTLQLEPLSSMREEMDLLHPLHWDETATGSLLSRRNFCWDSYLVLESRGLLQCLSVRQEGRLVGYCLTLLMPHLHSGDLVAMVDNYFLHPDARKGRAGIELLKAAEREWRKAGAQVALLATRKKNDHSRLLEYLGFEAQETVFGKKLEG